MRDPDRFGELLARLRARDPDAERELFPLLYEELRAIAGVHMAGQRADHTLQATALVNEAWIKVTGGQEREWADRAHFLRVASNAMRQVLVDHARRKSSLKRGADRMHVHLDGLVLSMEQRSGGLLGLDEALHRLQERDPQAVQLVELRFFGGCTLAEAAVAMGITERQASRWWDATRLILHEELGYG
jgi:RNA polymerase sigma factor (TIGR02999 family)